MRRPHEGDTTSTISPLAPYAHPSYQAPAYGSYGAAPMPSTPVIAANTLPTFWGLVNALKRRWVLACFLGLLAGLAAAAGLWIGMPEGRHQVVGMLEVQPLRTTLDNSNSGNDENFANFKKNQEILIKTRTLLSRVIENPRVASLPMIADSEDPVMTLSDLIRTSWKAPDVIAVMMNGNNPEQLRIMLDELMKAYEKESRMDQQRAREKRKEQLEMAMSALRKKIDNYESVIRAVTNQQIPSTDQAFAAVINQITSIQTQTQTNITKYKDIINKLSAELKQIEAKLKTIDTDKISDAQIDVELSKEKSSSELNKRIDDQMRVLADYKRKSVDQNSPKIIEEQTRLDELYAQRDALRMQGRAEVERRYRAEVKAKLESERDANVRELATAKELLGKEEEDYAAITERMKNSTKLQSTILLTQEDLKPAKATYIKLSSELTDLELQQKSEGRIQIREDAQVIWNHNQKQKIIFSAVVALGSFFGVLGLVAFLEWRSRRVDSVDQVVNDIGLRIIGTIPAFPSRASLKAGEADQNQNWRFILNESVNSTRTMLLHTAKTQSMQVIMVTSATQGEGKTSLSSQLATSMATAGLRTLILDCDLRNPSMHRLFDVNLTPGASEILLQEVDVSEAVQPTTVPNLWMIPAGQCSNRVVAALAQGHPVESMFNRLRGQFDFIVVDSCPVLPVADALLIAQHVDGVVISILQDISQLPKVLNASERLTQLNIPLLGAVVNGIKTDVHAYGYNYVKQLPA